MILRRRRRKSGAGARAPHVVDETGYPAFGGRFDGVAARPAARLVAPSATPQIEVNYTVPAGEIICLAATSDGEALSRLAGSCI